MFDIGFWEMAIIGAVALIVIGPERLPGVARTTGRWVGKGRRMLNEVKADIKKEVREQELHELKELKQELGSISSDIKEAADNPDILGLRETGEQIRESVADVSSELNEVSAEVKSAEKAPKRAAAKKTAARKTTASKTVAKTPSRKAAAKNASTRKTTMKKTATAKKPAPPEPKTGKTAAPAESVPSAGE